MIKRKLTYLDVDVRDGRGINVAHALEEMPEMLRMLAAEECQVPFPGLRILLELALSGFRHWVQREILGQRYELELCTNAVGRRRVFELDASDDGVRGSVGSTDSPAVREGRRGRGESGRSCGLQACGFELLRLLPPPR